MDDPITYKQKVLSKIIENAETEYSNQLNIVNGLVDTINESPNAMQSHSDQSRFLNSQLADSMGPKIKELLFNINNAKRYRFTKQDSLATIGSLVALRVNDKEDKNYMILPFLGGYSCEMDNKSIYVISPKAPLALNIINKPKESKFSLRGLDYIIKEII